MIGVVSVPVQSFVYNVKEMGDRTVPCACRGVGWGAEGSRLEA